MLASVNSIYTWIGKYVSQSESLSLQPQTSDEMANKSKDDQIRELKAVILPATAAASTAAETISPDSSNTAYQLV